MAISSRETIKFPSKGIEMTYELAGTDSRLVIADTTRANVDTLRNIVIDQLDNYPSIATVNTVNGIKCHGGEEEIRSLIDDVLNEGFSQNLFTGREVERARKELDLHDTGAPRAVPSAASQFELKNREWIKRNEVALRKLGLLSEDIDKLRMALSAEDIRTVKYDAGQRVFQLQMPVELFTQYLREAEQWQAPQKPVGMKR